MRKVKRFLERSFNPEDFERVLNDKLNSINLILYLTSVKNSVNENDVEIYKGNGLVRIVTK
jgi:hypothetical protein